MQAVIFSVIGPWHSHLLAQCCQLVAESGGRMGDSRLMRTADQAVLSLQVLGAWDVLAKIERALSRLAQQTEAQVIVTRTDTTEAVNASGFLPYLVEAIVPAETDVIPHLVAFFHEQQVDIVELQSHRYLNPQTQTILLAFSFMVHIPITASLVLLRNEFIDLCDALNIDAMLSPLR